MRYDVTKINKNTSEKSSSHSQVNRLKQNDAKLQFSSINAEFLVLQHIRDLLESPTRTHFLTEDS